MSMEATLATWELTKASVNSREKFFLLSLARRAGEEHTCWPSIKRMVEDTGFDRKTVVDVRQSVIDKKLINYTGRMVGRSGQIPEMKLLYVDEWERNRNSPRLKDELEVVDNFPKNTLTSTENGTGTSPKNGTGTSTENGTLNSKVEYNNRNKSFCNNEDQKANNEKKPAWAEKPKSPFSDPTKQSTSHKPAAKDKRASLEVVKKEMMKLAWHLRPPRYRPSVG